MRYIILLALLALTSCVSTPRPTATNPYHNMNLTDLANHICEQCGMNDSDDVAAAKMFLQRRLEMIWNTQLWRASLIEATTTVNPDGTCTLSNTVWIPSRSTLLLPPEFDSVLAVRADNHAMNVASLESYYRTDTDWLDMQGDPTEFQVLRPAAMEWATPQPLFVSDLVLKDSALPVSVAYSPDGIRRNEIMLSPTAPGTSAGNALVLYSASKPASAGDVQLLNAQQPNVSPNGTIFVDMTNAPWYVYGVCVSNDKVNWLYYPFFPGYLLGGPGNPPHANAVLNIPAGYKYLDWAIMINGGGGSQVWQPLSPWNDYYVSWWTTTGGNYALWNPPAGLVNFDPNYLAAYNFKPIPANPDPTTLFQLVTIVAPGVVAYAFGNVGFQWSTVTSIPASLLTASFATIPADETSLQVRQRIRLTTQPQLSTNLRILGKTSCPVLGDYDTMPINNVEPCLMAFARGDMLLRQRQNGKAQLAAQEGASLLAQLARSEAFQTANNFRIVPDNGFGGDNVISQPNSLHPL